MLRRAVRALASGHARAAGSQRSATTSAAVAEKAPRKAASPRPAAASHSQLVAGLFDTASFAQRGWAATPLSERCAVVTRFNEQLLAAQEDTARYVTQEMGKPLAQARAEVRGSAARLAAQVADAPAALAPRVALDTPSLVERVEYEPLGVVANISAWNYPIATAANVFGAALLAGNAVLYKPSELVPGMGARLAALLAAAGLPDGVFLPVPPSRGAGRALAAQPGLGAVCFTGSPRAGRAVGAAAAATGARATLELGGKDAAYVREDADVEAAAEALADGACYNAGQSCCAVERVYVHASVAAAFTAALGAAVGRLQVGDPFEEATQVGPLARRRPAAQLLADHVADALARGAALVHRAPLPPGCPGLEGFADAGSAPPRAGAGRPGRRLYYPPTVLAGCDHSMRVMREESFGPIVGVQAVASDAEAAALMDDSPYGLTAAVYTRDEGAALAILRALKVGTGYWNACDRVSARLPWGGCRDSGPGVTLGVEGLRAMARPKALHLLRPA